MTRLNPFAVAADQMQLLIDYATTAGAELDPVIRRLVKVRASQINGCAVCLHMHTQEARKEGESEERLYLLDAWEEAQVYTGRERAALAWTDALTRVCETRAPDEAYDAVTAQFSAEEVVRLTMVINAINAFNRIGVGFRRAPIGLAPAKAA
jgi:AhpD family alkylhydroperoxidase